jgi:hypothetical protein
MQICQPAATPKAMCNELIHNDDMGVYSKAWGSGFGLALGLGLGLGLGLMFGSFLWFRLGILSPQQDLQHRQIARVDGLSMVHLAGLVVPADRQTPSDPYWHFNRALL